MEQALGSRWPQVAKATLSRVGGGGVKRRPQNSMLGPAVLKGAVLDTLQATDASGGLIKDTDPSPSKLCVHHTCTRTRFRMKFQGFVDPVDPSLTGLSASTWLVKRHQCNAHAPGRKSVHDTLLYEKRRHGITSGCYLLLRKDTTTRL